MSRGCRSWARVLALVVLGCLTACQRHPELIVKTTDNHQVRAETIDQDPLALLPGGAIGLMAMDVQRLYVSPLGPSVLQLAQRYAPVPTSANYDPQRDLQRIYVGFYSMQGADVAGVAQGTFDPAAIEASADGVQTTPLGVPVVATSYAGRNLYLAANLGFVVLTAHTVVFGNETAIRRTLDRIDRGALAREAPRWALELIDPLEVPFALALDFESNPVSAAVRGQIPFTNGLERVRMVGNFESPGVNLAGTARYGDQALAAQGATNMNDLERTLRQWSWAAALLGLQQPIRRLEAQPEGAEVDFVVGLDAAAVAALLGQLSGQLAQPTGGTTP